MLRWLLLLTVLWLGIGLRAMEKEVLCLDFGSADWEELTSERWGKLHVENGILAMVPDSGLRTALLPICEGENIKVEFSASCKGLKGKDYRVGWCTVSYFDAAKQPVGHADTLQMREDTPWRNVSIKIAPPGRCAYFRADFTHSGTAGMAYYRDIRLFLNDNIATELIGDSDFNDQLGVNSWFFRRTGRDWDGFAYWRENASAEPDFVHRVSGSRSLRLTGGAATLVSGEFPYNGERLIVSGWLRSADMKRGRTSWAGAGVQLAGLDEKGMPVIHQDLCIRVDDKPWQYYSQRLSFPAAVKKVQVFIRFFDTASGRLWVDGLRLRSIPRGAVLPFEPKANTLTVDAGAPEPKPINYRTWAGIDALFAGWLLSPNFRQYLPYLKAAGIEMIRFREICNGLGMYPGEDKDGKPVYNFKRFDELFDLLTREGFVPNITIGTTPPALSRPGKANWCNPSAPCDFGKWGAFIEAMFTHAVQRYGVKEVNRWYWEIWNEPVLPSTHGDYVGSAEDFVNMATEIYLAKERVDAKYGTCLRMGATSGGQAGASDEYLFAKLQQLGKLNLIVHRSVHCYAGISNSIRSIAGVGESIRKLGKQFKGTPEYETGVTEWNGTAMSSPYTDKPWNAAMAVKMVGIFLDAGLDYSTFFALAGHPEIPQGTDPFRKGGDLAMFTRPFEAGHPEYGTLVTIPKPVYNAFLMLNELKGGRRLPVKRSAEPVDAIAVRKTDGTLLVLLAGYDEDTARQPYVTRTTLRIAGTPGIRYRAARLLACDDEHGNSYGEWEKRGRPGIDNRDALKTLVAASVPAALKVPEVSYRDGVAIVTLDVPSPGIRLLELVPEK